MSDALIQSGTVLANRALCREHLCLTFCVSSFPPARPGQFVHLSPSAQTHQGYTVHEGDSPPLSVQPALTGAPMLRRAFSIADLRLRAGGQCEMDVIYRVVGAATRWMASLKPSDTLSVLGPLGNVFPIDQKKSTAWLVAGGVGLPPMLWLAAALGAAQKHVVAFCGAQSASLLALEMTQTPPARSAAHATLSSVEFAAVGAGVVLATDDGSLGFCGHVGDALVQYHRANPVSPDDVVVYTCGPERMMGFVSDYCAARSISCYVCMEQTMACGTGTCQSCAQPVLDSADPAGWRYALCCTEGPVFDSTGIAWGFDGDPNYRVLAPTALN